METTMVDKAVLITGASRGLGAATAHWLAAAGCALTLMARDRSALARVAAEVQRRGGRALVHAGDVADDQAGQRAVAAALDRWGRLDALINNAAVLGPLDAIADAHPRQWRRSLEVNVAGPFALIRAALPALRHHRGRVVNVSSGAAEVAIAAASAYCAGKAALNHLTRVLAAEEPRVTAVAVRPGVVDTQMQAQLRERGPQVMPAEQARFYLELKAAHQLEPPRVPARAIAWLALAAPADWSGRFLNSDDPHVAEPARAFFGPGGQ
jgi:NAD(P)-dependent dehydrogenase (short-subunit alcohol dehydrogenase family)